MYKSGGYSSIGSVDLACDYLVTELRADFPSILSVLETTKSIRTASDKVLHDFENPADQSQSVEIARAEFGQEIYDAFHDSQATFVPRLDDSGLTSNPWYTSKNPFHLSGFGLPNCTCYAWGRRGEITGEAPSTSLGDAETWFDWNKANNAYPYGQTPKLGAIAVWKYADGGAGHVGIVEQINSDGSVVISNSANGGSIFYHMTLSQPYEWSDNSIFQGFIYLPDTYTPDIPTPSIPIRNRLSRLLFLAVASDAI